MIPHSLENIGKPVSSGLGPEHSSQSETLQADVRNARSNPGRVHVILRRFEAVFEINTSRKTENGDL
jgi:hypothetical protein